MKIKSAIRTIVIFLLVFLISVLLHVALFGRLKLGAVAPNILIIVTAAMGYMKGSNYGAVMGFLCGLIMDGASFEFFGLNCLIYLLIGYINGFFAKIFYGDDIKMPMLLAFGSDALYGIAIYSFTFLTRGRTDFYFYLQNIIIPEAIYTLLVSLLFYYPLLKVIKWISINENREKYIE